MDFLPYQKFGTQSQNFNTASVSPRARRGQELSPRGSAEAMPYTGHHPHFYHHTTPIYYTDVNLRIHKSPLAPTLNDHYQSVYETPSQLLEPHHFETSSTDRGSPSAWHPKIDRQTYSSAFFRGGSVDKNRKSIERLAKSSPANANPTKGETTASPLQPQRASGGAEGPVQSSEAAVGSPASSGRSRNPSRFASHIKRAVRVRSESRPISALYDIICQEKGLEVDTSETSDVDEATSKDTARHSRRHADAGRPGVDVVRTIAPITLIHYNPPSARRKSSGATELGHTGVLSDDENEPIVPRPMRRQLKASAKKRQQFNATATKASSLPPPNTSASPNHFRLHTETSTNNRANPSISPHHLHVHSEHTQTAPSPTVIAKTVEQSLGSERLARVAASTVFDKGRLCSPTQSGSPCRPGHRKRQRDERRCMTESAMSPMAAQSSVVDGQRHESDDETQGRGHATNTRRFIKRSSNPNGGSPSQRSYSSSSTSPAPPSTDTARMVSVSPLKSSLHRNVTNGNSGGASFETDSTVMTNAAASNGNTTAAGARTDTGRGAGPAATSSAAELANNSTAAAAAAAKANSKKSQVQARSLPQLLIKPNNAEASKQQQTSDESASEPERREAFLISRLTERMRKISIADISPMSEGRRLVPTVSVSMNQNLCEMHFNGNPVNSGCTREPNYQNFPPETTDCTFKPNAISQMKDEEEKSGSTEGSLRPRCSTMHGKTSPREPTLDLSPVRNTKSPDHTARQSEDRDKSSKRKSNLNRSLNEEAANNIEESTAQRRRRRRELGMARQLIPNDDPALREIISTHRSASSVGSNTQSSQRSNGAITKPLTGLAMHMENARCSHDLLATATDKRRSHTITPRYDLSRPRLEVKLLAGSCSNSPRSVTRRSDTLPLSGEDYRKMRSNDVNRKLNERTQSDLAEIRKIVELANIKVEDSMPLIDAINSNVALEKVRQATPVDGTLPPVSSQASFNGETFCATTARPEQTFSNDTGEESNGGRHATFTVDNLNGCITYDRGDEEDDDEPTTIDTNGRISPGHKPPFSPILRRKSTDDVCSNSGLSAASNTLPTASPQNHIVSILKKKDYVLCESSSTSSNASPVTFSAHVTDPSKSKKKHTGILKKRSSLDESRYYSRSHSPDERSILVKSARRNSLEETAAVTQHGILKQSSYDSNKSDGCPSATEMHPTSILKKKDSTSTPSESGSHGAKHVSISQAVILAAAELGRSGSDANISEFDDAFTPSNEEYEIRPILKTESTSSDEAARPPKPILKKKSIGEMDEQEIRPILKTSRKSSREEFCLSDGQSSDYVRPILKVESPLKRRSLGDESETPVNDSGSPSLLKRRTCSLERHEPPVVDLAEALNAISTAKATQPEVLSTPTVMSVAERVKYMEMILSGRSSASTSLDNSCVSIDGDSPQKGAVPKTFKPSILRREQNRDRFQTQPVTSDEKNCFKINPSYFGLSPSSAFKPTKSYEALNYVSFASLQQAQSQLNSPQTPNFGKTFSLARSFTQPLNCVSPPPPFDISQDSVLALDNDTTSSTIEKLTLSVSSDSERIFDMSSTDQDSSATVAESDAGNEAVNQDLGSQAPATLLRKNSVRARANMFQQLQQEPHNKPVKEERASLTPRVELVRHHSPTPQGNSTPTDSLMLSQSQEEEIEPSSLPLSERLRFFSNLSAVSNRSSFSSYTRSASYASSHNSYNGHSRMHTPTPTDYSSLGPLDTTLSAADADLDAEMSEPEGTLGNVNAAAYSNMAKRRSQSQVVVRDPDERTSPASMVLSSNGMTPMMKRIRLKTIGKLMMPQTFLNNDRNNNMELECDGGGRVLDNTPAKKIGRIKSIFIEQQTQQTEEQQYAQPHLPTPQRFSCADNLLNSKPPPAQHEQPRFKRELPPPTPTVSPPSPAVSPQPKLCHGKCMKYDAESTPHNGQAAHEDQAPVRRQNGVRLYHQGCETDPCKENYKIGTERSATTPVVDLRKKFTRLMSGGTEVRSAPPLNRQNQQPSRASQPNTSISPTGSRFSAIVAPKYAKFFGLADPPHKPSETRHSVSASSRQTGPPATQRNHVKDNRCFPSVTTVTRLNNLSEGGAIKKVHMNGSGRYEGAMRGRTLATANVVHMQSMSLATRQTRKRRSVTPAYMLVKQCEDILMTEDELLQADTLYDTIQVTREEWGQALKDFEHLYSTC